MTALTALTPRERDVLDLLARGASTQQAADTLHISRSSVRRHAEHIRWKTGSANMREATWKLVIEPLLETK